MQNGFSKYKSIALIIAICSCLLHFVVEVSWINIRWFFAIIIGLGFIYAMLLPLLKMTNKIFKYRFFIVGLLFALMFSVAMPFVDAGTLDVVVYKPWDFAFRFVFMSLLFSGMFYWRYKLLCKRTRFKRLEGEFVVISDAVAFDNGDFAKRGRLILTNKRLSVVAMGKGKLLFNKMLTELPEELKVIKPGFGIPGGLNIPGTEIEITVAYPKFWEKEIKSIRS